MEPELTQESTWSFWNGQQILEKKNLIDDLPAIAAVYEKYGGGNQNLSKRRDILDPLGWEQTVSTTFEAPTSDGSVSRRASFDAYKDGIIVEHERGEQMRANWHLLKMDAAYRDPRGFSQNRSVDAGVLLIPDHVRFPTLDRTQTDVQAVLSNYFGFSLPLFVWQYPTDQ